MGLSSQQSVRGSRVADICTRYKASITLHNVRYRAPYYPLNASVPPLGFELGE
jgi:hypothetical protein